MNKQRTEVGDIFVTMHRLFRRLQQKNRFVHTDTQFEVNLVEVHFLLELEASNELLTLSESSRLLGVEFSVLSRTAKSLNRRGILLTSKRRDDPRQKQLKLTKKGKKIISALDDNFNGQIKVLSKELKPKQFKELVRFLHAIADGYGEPMTPKRRSEPDFRVAQRRITRAFRLLRNDAYGSLLSSSEWQVLAELSLSDPLPIQVTELSNLLGMGQAHISTIALSLEKKKLIRRVKSKKDRRITNLLVTSQGKKRYRESEEHTARLLAEGLSPYSDKQHREWLKLLQLYVGEKNAALPPLLPGYVLTPVTKSEEYAEARGAIARILVAKEEESRIPEQLLPKSSIPYVLRIDGDVSVIFEVANSKSFSKVLFATWLDEVSPWVLSACINKLDDKGSSSFPEFIKDKTLLKALEARG